MWFISPGKEWEIDWYLAEQVDRILAKNKKQKKATLKNFDLSSLI
jgi:hypothetical protein